MDRGPKELERKFSMIDYDIYNERRQEIIDRYGGYYVDDFLNLLGLSITDIVDLVDWEDSEQLALEMGWTESETTT